MSIDHQPDQRPVTLPSPPSWGELADAGEHAQVIRFVMEDRVVTFPLSQVKRWEHQLGEPEYLLIVAHEEVAVIEGHELSAVRAALDHGRLTEVRANRSLLARPGPRIREISLETA